MSPSDAARLAREKRIAFVITDYDGPLQRTLDCLICRTTWRVYLSRFGIWPPDWWHCPNSKNHPDKDGSINEAAARPRPLSF